MSTKNSLHLYPGPENGVEKYLKLIKSQESDDGKQDNIISLITRCMRLKWNKNLSQIEFMGNNGPKK